MNKKSLNKFIRYNINYSFVNCEFWYKDKFNNYKIDRLKYLEFLNKNGFRKYYLCNDEIKFIRITNNIIELFNISKIKDFVLFYIKEYKTENNIKMEIIRSLLKAVNIYFEKGLIECLKPVKLNIKKDTKEKAFFYFKNSVVEITKNGINLIEYKELKYKIWKSYIKDFNFTIDENYKTDFKTFLFNTCNKNEILYNSLISVIGYLLHSYKDVLNTKAIIFYDENLNYNSANGRSGKSLIGKAISYIKNTVRIDGRNFDFNKNFAFQLVELDTQIIEFNDVSKNFDFDRLYSIITDNLTVEKKNKSSFIIPFSESPKILISSNYIIKGNDNSTKDRKNEIGITNYYNINHKPINEFKKSFFNEWNSYEWNSFYNFMFDCIRFYLINGIIPYNSEIINRKSLIHNTSFEFVEFFESEIINNFEYNRKELYEKYIIDIPFKYRITMRTFANYIRLYCEYSNLKLIESKKGGNYYIYIENEKEKELNLKLEF